MDSQNTDRILSLLKVAGRYSCRLNCRLYNTGKAMDRAEYERRAFNNPPKPEDFQIMRYLARLDYADAYMLTLAAESYRSEFGNTGIVDLLYIKQILKKLLDTGIVHERRYVNDGEVDSNGRPITNEKTPRYYCLSGYGQNYYKNLSSSREFLEEYLFSKSDFEIMKRLAGNYATLKCHKDFNGNFVTSSFAKFEKLGHMPIYGKYENDEHIVVFEPVFFNYNPIYVNDDDFQKSLRMRVQFIQNVFNSATETKKKSLVILVESREHLKEAVLAFESVMEYIDRIYVTSEYALGTVSAQEGTTKSAFLKVAPAPEGKVSIIAETPIFMN